MESELHASTRLVWCSDDQGRCEQAKAKRDEVCNPDGHDLNDITPADRFKHDGAAMAARNPMTGVVRGLRRLDAANQL